MVLLSKTYNLTILCLHSLSLKKKLQKKKSNVQIHCDITYPIWWFCFEIKVIHPWLHLEPNLNVFPWERSDFWPGYFFSLTSEFDMIMAEKKVIVLPCSISWVEYKMSHSRMPTHCTLHAFSPQHHPLKNDLNIHIKHGHQSTIQRQLWIRSLFCA